MCSICGIYAPRGVGLKDCATVREMSQSMAHRGPDAKGFYVGASVAFHHNRLAVVDITGGAQPMTIRHEGKSYTVVYNGELYNTADIQRELSEKGVHTQTSSDTEAVVYAYAVWRENCVEHMNGIFAFTVYDEFEQVMFCARDRLGVKPFFYTQVGNSFLFSSEIKSLLRHPNVKAEIDLEGLWQLLYLSPITIPGSGVFRSIKELLPGEWCRVSLEGIQFHRYWEIQAHPHVEGRDETIARVRTLVTDAIQRQLVSDVPLCSFLSGGLDSSVVSSVAAEAYRENGQILSTYSFEYEGNSYEPTLFQPNADDRYAILMAEYIGSDHTVLTASSAIVAEQLLPAVASRDFPGQADIDSSLRYFCGRVRENHTVALSGECADEIFGGYPWFYRPEMITRDFFPWIHDPHARIKLFRDEVVHAAEGYDYLSQIYRQSVQKTQLLPEESAEDQLARIATKLSVDYFMASLLERKDRMSMAHGLEVRVPFSDHRILDYVYNVPWSIKFEGQEEKALLRNAMAAYLPESVLHRKKSPYPKTHNPAYETQVRQMLLGRLSRKNSPLASMLAPGALESLMQGGDATWLGQLMGRPQMYAWLLQFDYWLCTYHVDFAF